MEAGKDQHRAGDSPRREYSVPHGVSMDYGVQSMYRVGSGKCEAHRADVAVHAKPPPQMDPRGVTDTISNIDAIRSQWPPEIEPGKTPHTTLDLYLVVNAKLARP